MNMKKNLIGMLGVYLSLAEMGSASFDSAYHTNKPKSKSGGIPYKPKKIIPNGCKEYIFWGIKVIASNEKSAIKKCTKQFEKLYGRKP